MQGGCLGSDPSVGQQWGTAGPEGRHIRKRRKRQKRGRNAALHRSDKTPFFSLFTLVFMIIPRMKTRMSPYSTLGHIII